MAGVERTSSRRTSASSSVVDIYGAPEIKLTAPQVARLRLQAWITAGRLARREITQAQAYHAAQLQVEAVARESLGSAS